MVEKTTRENRPQRQYSDRCFLCMNEDQDFSYKEVIKLKRFLNERDMIIPRQKSRLCAYHQRELSSNIKKARFLALLPVGGRRNLD